jgi:hypothetical protein
VKWELAGKVRWRNGDKKDEGFFIRRELSEQYLNFTLKAGHKIFNHLQLCRCLHAKRKGGVERVFFSKIRRENDRTEVEDVCPLFE